MSSAWQDQDPGTPAIFAIGSLLAAFLPRDRRDDLLGDLEEGYYAQASEHGPAGARRWYLSQILKSIPPLAGHMLAQWMAGMMVRAEAGILGEPPIEIARQWMGKAFFLFATGWIACVFCLMRPALAPEQMLPRIELPNSQGFAVYLHPSHRSAGMTDIRDCPCWNALGWNENDLILTAFGPPLSIVFASLIWIGFSDRRQVASALRTAIFID